MDLEVDVDRTVQFRAKYIQEEIYLRGETEWCEHKTNTKT